MPPIEPEAVRALEPLLRAYARRAVSDPELAKDLVQDTLLAAVERAEPVVNLRAFVIGVLGNKVIDHFRRKKPQVLEIPEVEDEDLLSRPDHALDQKRAARQVDLALPQLPELERMAILLVDIEGLEREDAQKAMSVSAVHLRVLLHRGRNRLRRKLEHVAL